MPADDADDGAELGPPLPPDDRLWRHPTEVAWTRRAEPDPRGVRAGGTWGVALVAGLSGALLALGVVAVVTGFDRRVVERVTERVVMDDVVGDTLAGGPVRDLAVLVDRIVPSVVRLEVTGPTGSRIGSAVVVRDDGQLVTNAHVIGDADTIAVVTAEGLAVTASLVGIDHETDIAVIAIDDEFRDEAEWVPAVMGRSSTVRVGNYALAVGSPLGLQGDPSVSAGLIGGLDRRVQSSDGLTLTGLLQTDAAIAQGSSGGALVDASGAVIGITTAVAVGEEASDGLGFAVPIDVARDVIDRFLGGGGERGAWLGIEGIDGAGVAVVSRVVPGSPAAEGGLREGDVLVAIDGEPTPSMSRLVDELEEREPGDVVVLDVERDGEPMEMHFQLEER